jgi:plastocyanin
VSGLRKGGAPRVAALHFIVACSAAATPAIAEPQETRVEIANFAFSPPELIVKAGATLVFVNRDRVPHSIVGEQKGREIFRSDERIDEDDSFRIVLETPGELALRCGLHSGIRARVIVTP